MKVLIVGGGGREHALAWKAAQSEQVAEVLVAPGNAGTARESKVRNVAVSAEDIDGLLALAGAEGVDLTIVGPEAPLVAGITDRFAGAGRMCLGPHRKAAQLEGSKVFAKDFMARHGIPTAAYASFTDLAAARDYVRAHGTPLVIKADGLAAGKGVRLAVNAQEAFEALEGMLRQGAFGDAGRRVVIEDLLVGEEASFIVMVDGSHILELASSQDHKARDDGDAGPNTGGMGAYSPAPVVTAAVRARVLREVIEPTVRGLAAEGQPYVGFLYAGLMMTPDGVPRVLEFNCRLGDPETQPILLRLKSDLIPACIAALEGRLAETALEWDPRVALGVVMAAGGYPEAYRKGDVIAGLGDEEGEGLKVFHAGTALRDGRAVTNGRRVLCVTAMGGTAAEAQARAYARVREIGWEGVYYRTDIGYRAVRRNGRP